MNNMYPIDFVSYYSSENFDFKLINDDVDIVLGYSEIPDFILVGDDRIDFTLADGIIDYDIDETQIIDFGGYYSTENFDFEVSGEDVDFELVQSEFFDFILIGDDRIDFAIDDSDVIDFEINDTIPLDEYVQILSQYKPAPDNVEVYDENYLITEDDIPISTENKIYLIY